MVKMLEKGVWKRISVESIENPFWESIQYPVCHLAWIYRDRGKTESLDNLHQTFRNQKSLQIKMLARENLEKLVRKMIWPWQFQVFEKTLRTTYSEANLKDI